MYSRIVKNTVSRYNRTRSRNTKTFEQLLVEVHTNINRYDVEKDAVKETTTPIRANVEFFRTCANTLFGPLQDVYTRSKVLLQTQTNLHTIMSHVLVENHKMQVSETVRRDDTRMSFKLPECVKYGIQDAGRNPIHYKEDIQLIKTPGSYLDPASRTRTLHSFGLTSEITLEEFASFGMPHIAHFRSYVDSTSCILEIQFAYSKTITAVFDANTYAPKMEHEYMYFLGNDTKNSWFNSLTIREYSDELLREAYTYILVKELGDTLQAYYGKLFLDSIDPSLRNSLCVFTNDIPMSMRCRLFNVPVVVVDKETTRGSLYDSLYYPTPGIIGTAMQSVYENQCTVHNGCVIRTIEKVMKHGVCIIETEIISINHNIQIFLQSIIDSIHRVNTIATDMMRTRYMNMEQHRKFLSILHACHIFRLDQGDIYTVDNDITTVFGISEHLEEYEEKYEFIDPIRAKGTDLRTILKSMLDASDVSSIQIGGGSTPFVQKYMTITEEDTATEDYEYAFELRLEHMIYTYLLKHHADLTIAQMHDIILTICNHFYHYQTYTASINLNTAFIHPFIEEYLTKKTLSHITLEAYAKRDKAFRANLKLKPPIAFPVFPESKHPVGLNRTIRTVARAGRRKTRRSNRMYAFNDSVLFAGAADAGVAEKN